VYATLSQYCPPHTPVLSIRHGRLKHFDALLIRERDAEGEGFVWLHSQVARESLAGVREFPHGASALEGNCAVGDMALQGERR
jgi:hypothetical protein